MAYNFTKTGAQIAAIHTKVDGIETAATADQTGDEIKTAYELEADTNAYTDAEKTTVSNTTGVNTGDQDATDIDLTDSSDYYTGADVEAVLAEIGETRAINGYDLLTAASLPDLAFDSATRTFTVSVKAGSSNFYLWVDSKKVIKTASESVVIPDVTGTYYVYFDNAAILQYANQDILPLEVFYENVITGVVYWNEVEGYALAGQELHGKLMDSRTHHKMHSTVGALYESGLDITGLTNGGATYTSISSGKFWDEDIQHSLALQTDAPFIWREGADGAWKESTPDLLVAHKLNVGDAYFSWNEWNGTTWGLSQGGAATDFWIVFTIATADLNGYTTKKIIGQNAYSTRGNARAALESEVNAISLNGLPSPEFTFLHAWIVRRTGTLVDDGDGNAYIDLRAYKGGVGSTSGSAALALDVATDITNFNGVLSATDTTVQSALDTIDDGVMSKQILTDNAVTKANGTAGEIQNSGVIIDDSNNVYGAGILANVQTGTAYTLALSDAGKLVTIDNAAAITLTIPANSSVSFEIGTVINLLQLGTGQVTVAITTDTLSSSGSLVLLSGQYSAASLVKTGATTWVLFGDIA